MKKIPFLIDIVATGFFVGKIPFMPGTFGTLIALPIAYVTAFLPFIVKFGIFVFMFLLGIYTSNKYVDISGIEDPKQVVIDEIAAMYLVLILFPVTNIYLSYILIPFILFRVFDILKPFPIKQLEEIHGGLGIMLDDIVAGVYAMICCYLIFYIANKFGYIPY